MVLCRKIGHTQQITPIHFEVTRSNVKVTVPLNAKTLSAQYLEKLWVTVIVLGRKICHGQ